MVNITITRTEKMEWNGSTLRRWRWVDHTLKKWRWVGHKLRR
jgi:hypothetical protein